ncbi:signal peptidase II [Luteococcus peritonei]|uniref:Lipoprotein signal peptidase n=1 Tax=Luteococcus peritonei TaxID=88874 RepID=A0ABW4RQT5_9ACTN
MAATALAGVVLDQSSKALAVARLDPENPPRLLGGLLRLQLIRNPGAAFSLGSGATVVISLLALAAALAMVLVVAPRLQQRWQGLLAGLATAGIVGNLLDRLLRPPGVLRGHVVDFFQLPHFAIFNVADIFITLTAVVLVVLAFRGEGEDREQERR